MTDHEFEPFKDVMARLWSELLARALEPAETAQSMAVYRADASVSFHPGEWYDEWEGPPND